LLLEGHLSKLSIGYETTDDAYEERGGQRVRLLKGIKLWETSVVVFPMNAQAVVSTVKSGLEGGLDDRLAVEMALLRLAAMGSARDL
jgi:phage head maturation protease